MDFIERVTEDHMVAAFVRAEFDSARFRQHYRAGVQALRVNPRGLIDKPDLSNQRENEKRRILLRGVRGYGANLMLFQRWPAGVEWWRVRVSLAELGTFKFANYQTWLDLTKGSRLVSDGAANVGTVMVREAGVDINANIRVVTARVRRGDRFPELILLAQSRNDPVVLMEGHTRATAYVLASAPDPIDCLLGISPHMNNWFYWVNP